MNATRKSKINYVKNLFLLIFILLSMVPLRFIFSGRADSYFGMFLILLSFLYIASHIQSIVMALQTIKFLILFYVFVVGNSLIYFIDSDAGQYNEMFRLTFIFALAIVLSNIKYDKFIVKNFDYIFLSIGVVTTVFALIYSKLVLDINFLDLVKHEELSYVKQRFKYKGFGSGTVFAYILLLLFNLAFLNFLEKKRRALYILTMVFTSFLIFYTIQRGILLQLLISIGLLTKMIKGKFLKYSLIGYLIISSILYQFWEDYYYRFFIEPMISMETFSSGRSISLRLALDNIKKFDIFEILAGQGTNRINLILEEYGFSMLHNDYLMVFSNYGIIGSALWILFLLSMFRVSLKYFRSNDNNIRKLSIISTIFILNLALASLHTNMIHEYKGFILSLLPLFIIFSCQIKNKNKNRARNIEIRV